MRQMATIEARLAQLESKSAEAKIDNNYQSNMPQLAPPIVQKSNMIQVVSPIVQ